MLHFCNVCNSATDFLALVECRVFVRPRKCCSISVCTTFLAEQGTFVLSFVSFNVASEVTEIGRISVVMHVSG